jgi:hypothetical protein
MEWACRLSLTLDEDVNSRNLSGRSSIVPQLYKSADTYSTPGLIKLNVGYFGIQFGFIYVGVKRMKLRQSDSDQQRFSRRLSSDRFF